MVSGKTIRNVAIAAIACLVSALAAHADSAPTIENGYAAMYNLEFDKAHDIFAQWERMHPEDPMGPASDAAAYLFSEFDRLHVLEFELFTDDHRFENRSSLAPDPQLKAKFEATLTKAEQLADAVLSRSPRDSNALFAKVLRLGLLGDYTAMIEKRDLQGLSYLKQGRTLAEQLLALDPHCYDAYVAVGVENYMLSLKPAPVRWFLRLGGAQTDQDAGLQKLGLTADKGHYLLPYARLLLAVAALRDHNQERARNLLAGLAREYPHNRLYHEELARLK
jgi:hypothetical protein